MFAERFMRDGCLVIDRLFEPTLIDAVREEIVRQHGAIDPERPPEHLKVGDRAGCRCPWPSKGRCSTRRSMPTRC